MIGIAEHALESTYQVMMLCLVLLLETFGYLLSQKAHDDGPLHACLLPCLFAILLHFRDLDNVACLKHSQCFLSNYVVVLCFRFFRI